MRFVLFGNGRAATLCLSSLAAVARTEDILVVAPAGGPHHDWHESLEAHSHSRGLKCLTPEDVNSPSSLEDCIRFAPNVVFSVGYTQILGDTLLRLPTQAINFHPSLLPEYRGVAPLVWAIVHGETMTGVTAHRMTPQVDRGEIYGQVEVSIEADDTGYSLHQKAAEATQVLFEETLDALVTGTLRARPMPPGGSLFTTRTPRVNRLVPDVQSVREIENIVRALATPLPCAFVIQDGRRIEIDAVDRDVAEVVRRELEATNSFGLIEHDSQWFLRVRDGCLRVADARFVGDDSDLERGNHETN